MDQMQTDHELTQLQILELDILRQIDALCKKHNISYMLNGGSMLGAVRHQGFIPWDDDIDIAMLRDDYDRFLKIAEDELDAPYALHTYSNCSDHHYYFSHVVDTRYQVRRTGSADRRVEDVWVDVYPIDGIPDNPLVRTFHLGNLLFDRFMYHMAHFEKVNTERADRPAFQKAILRVVSPISSLIKPDRNKWRDRMDKGLRKYSARNTKNAMNFISVYMLRESFPSTMFTDLEGYPYEDMIVPGPRDFDPYLRKMYGDYMTPISEGARHELEILFNEESPQ